MNNRSLVLVAMLASVLPCVDSLMAGEAGAAPRPSIEERLRRVEDELAIRRVLVDYSATQDARDYAAYAALFARDGEWVNGKNVYRGREAIHRMLVDLYGAPPPGYVNTESFHISSNPQVDVHGDRATARSRHLLVMRGPNGQPVPMLAGRYEDEFIREEGQWKILRRVDFPVMPTAEEWMKFIRERNAAPQAPR
ncbi:MAG TPA: nuclear transport factor 2 family protein [Steroidobacteraceae bacterium]|nr:nuclear transport factor 2 family protein [Steroidobacteraceae bacterium]